MTDFDQAQAVKFPIARYFRACFLASLTTPLLALLLWPFVVFLNPSKSTFGVDLFGLMTVTFWALIASLVVNLTIGFSILLLLEKAHKNNIFIAGSIGMIIPPLFFVCMGYEWAYQPGSLPLLALFALLGGVCGAFSSYLSTRN